MFKTISAFFGKVFGTEKALESTVLGISKSLDYLVHTDQEKAEEAAQERSEARKMVVGWMEATQGQNLSRRIIALSITFVWIMTYVIGKTAKAAGIFVDDVVTYDRIAEFSVVMSEASAEMSDPVMLILAFYFAAPHMSDITSSVLTRMNKKEK